MKKRAGLIIATRRAEQQQFWTTANLVDAKLKVIINTLVFIRQGMLVDMGLPVIVNLQPETRIWSWKIVDLWLEPSLRKTPDGQQN